MKPTLYVQADSTRRGSLAFDFCYDAKQGAELLGVKVKTFIDVESVPPTNTNIIVGSVEQSRKWLKHSGYTYPNALDMSVFNKSVLGRDICYEPLSNVKEQLLTSYMMATRNPVAYEYEPVFIKPSDDIKAFTGFIVSDPRFIELWSEGYNGMVQVQPVLDIESEYRVYVTNNQIIGMKHYDGNWFVYPEPLMIGACRHAAEQLNYHSYTLDIGVLADGSTILIEANDGFAVGNYGIDVEQYYLFLRNRWLQLTGIRTRMD